MTDAVRTFRLPDLGEGLTEAELVHWLVEVGDVVTVDQAIAEVETAKSVVELPTPFAGTVIALHGTPGDTVSVGSPVVEVGDPSAPSVKTAPPAEAETSDVELAAHRAEEQGGSGNVLIGYGTSGSHGAVRRRRRAEAVLTGPPTPTAADTPTTADTPLAADTPATADTPPASTAPVRVRSPLLRRVARDLGVDLRTVTGSGEGGAITRPDILGAASASAHTAGENTAGENTATPVMSAPTAPTEGMPVEVGRERLSMLRRTVAAKMTRSRSEIPEATVWVDVDATRLWELRPQMAPEGVRPPSLTALLARFTLLALAEYPLLASRLSEDGSEVIRYDGVNLGVAADTERGLLVPVIPRADLVAVGELDARLRELAGSAREGTLSPERMRGSTFTVNNYGSLGVDGSAAIINHPEVAILGIGRMIERPWVVAGEIVARRIVQLSLVFDHRICDGGYAAGFLRHIVGSIERPVEHYTRL